MPTKRGRGRPPYDDVLTPAEWRTVQAVRHGLTNAEIARRRGISLPAVKHHVEHAIAKLGLDNRRALRAWNGVPKASRLAKETPTMEPKMKVNAFGQVARSVRSAAESEVWYRDVLGLTHLFTFGTMAFFDCGGVRLMLTQKETPEPESILYFLVADIHAAHAAMNSRGVETISVPHLIHTHADGTEEWMMFFKDPEGRPLAFMART
jgi:DNA-binding CsgD family transcriptional regulator/catechol 2,3-dioxygenase-like lactoylglutathione lyase family enzyme